MRLLTRLRGRRTIRDRVLAIALVPIVALVIVGVALSGYLALQGIDTRTFASNVRSSLTPTVRLIAAVQEERRLTTMEVTGMVRDDTGLQAQRERVDAALREMKTVTAELLETAPEELNEPLRKFSLSAEQVPSFRQQVDGGLADPQRVYDFYSELLELVGAGIQGIARSATDAEVGFEQMISYDLFRSAEAQSRSHALVVRAIKKGLDPKEFHELAHQMGTYHEVVETIYPRMTPAEQKYYDAMKDSPWWKTLVDGDNAVMAQGPGKHQVTFGLAKWRDSATTLNDHLVSLYRKHSTYAADLGSSAGNAVLTTSLVAAGIVLLVSGIALAVALYLSRALIRRLSRLRADTLDLADRQMPEVVQRLGEGEQIDLGSDVAWLEHGDDEIGQVADAFNKAQRQAIEATVQETETRSGVRAVFLNMAQRNQVMAHKQLQVLDQAERNQDDPEQLRLLFELDHLATQGRRNAESLIILGGKQPGRQWRKPVPLREVIDGAIAETAQYTRINVGKMADLAVQGSAVGDMIHLLAELLDNATSFAPPQTDVDLRTAVVGKGVIIEIEDQGLGIEPERLEELNTMLRQPPDFSVMSLSEETRIGLFVVAQLAARHDVRVSLRESVYGGIRAIVLVPRKELVDSDMDTPEAPQASDAARAPEPATVVAAPVSAAEPVDEPTPKPTVVRSPVEEWKPSPGPSQPAATGLDTRTRITVNPGALGNGSSGTNGAGGSGGKPPLPRRRRQEHIAPQLAEESAAEQTAIDPAMPGEPQHGRPDEPGDHSAERFQASMEAFQRGTRRARDDVWETEQRPRWPGDGAT
jgi:signal transduction histidine kinase